MGKWSHLKQTLPPVPVDAKFQERVDFLKGALAGTPLDRVVAQYDALEDEKEKLKQQLSELNAAIEAHNRLLVTRMEDLGLQSLKLEGGRGSLILLDAPVFKVADLGAFERWVEETQPEIFTVNAQTREGICKARVEAGEPLPPGIEMTNVRTQVSRRAR